MGIQKPVRMLVSTSRWLAIAIGLLLLYRWSTVGFGNSFDPQGEAFWKLQYLQSNWPVADNSPDFIQNVIHPTRGWTPRPNLRFYGAASHVLESTNNRGHRSPVDYVAHPGRYTVAVLGDSFTFGQDAADVDVWPTVLQGLNADLDVVNLGVPGYGTDQMLITLKETIGEYKPQLVILAPISDDLDRAMLSFREYAKPKFIVDVHGGLALTHSPVGGKRDTLSQLRAECGFFRVKNALAEMDKEVRRRKETGAYEQERWRVNTGIVSEAARVARDAGSALLVVHLGSLIEIAPASPGGVKPSGSVAAETVLRDAARRSGAAFLATVPAFRASDTPWVMGHYGGSEARFVARLVYDAIRAEPSWKAYEAKKAAGGP